MPATPAKRSDQLRSKKGATIQNPKAAAGKRRKVTTAPSAPPVMARNPAQSISTKEYKPARKVRRRFDLTLNSPGVEMRLPALPQVHLGWRMLSFVLLGLFSFGLYTLWYSNQFRVPAARVVGLQNITSESVNTVLGISGTPVFTLDAGNLEQVLKAEFQEFSAAQAHIALPNSVVITVTERVPVLIWLQDERTNLVDENGITFPLRMENESLVLPVIEAEINPPAPPGQLADSLITEAVPTFDLGTFSALEAGENMQESSSRPLLTRDMVAAVLLMAKNAPPEALLLYTEEHGLVWKDKRGWSVYFGAPQDMEMKLKVYRAILDHTKVQDTRPELISVEFISAPYYRIAG